ncbi:Biotin/lipoate A/B protein ligase [Arachnomyces sp. PD_36]|nr:Biotin/lipoate A/B protein ligase [Arachnomyces sp. PD_36]
MLLLRRWQLSRFADVRPIRSIVSNASINCRKYSSTSSPSPTFTELSTRPSSINQIYQSRSTDPFVNLSIEHFLLQNSPSNSNILFLYTNRPCVVIGRNQNPWTETDLQALKRPIANSRDESEPPADNVLCVRRRSGGGTVFHDAGNLNFSVICPRDDFTRNKHAEMVVSALKATGADNARVNGRHDIVLDLYAQDPTPYKTVKVSGSAFKLTRLRALHHGTCLLDSPNLKNIGPLLKSPAKPYMKTKGVDSVSSPIGNISWALDSASVPSPVARVMSSVIAAFGDMYGVALDAVLQAQMAHPSESELYSGEDWVVGTVGDWQVDEESRIQEGVQELKSLDWKYTQTPQFSFSTHPTEDDPRPRPPLPSNLPPSTRVSLQVNRGPIRDCHISLSPPETGNPDLEAKRVRETLGDRKLHEISDWSEVLSGMGDGLDNPPSKENIDNLATWLNRVLRC